MNDKEYKELSFANIGGIIEKIDNKKNVVYLNTEEFWKVAVYDKGEKNNDDCAYHCCCCEGCCGCGCAEGD